MCCAESRQSVVSTDEQPMTDVEPDISELAYSEAGVVQTHPVSQSASPDSSVKPSVSPTLLEPTDISFNSSSSHAYTSEDAVYTDITSSLCRPAMFHEAASQLDNTTCDREIICANDEIGENAAVCTDSDVPNSHNAVVAVDEVPGSQYHAVSVSDGADNLDRDNTSSDEEFYSPSIHATVAADEELSDAVSAPVAVASDDEVLSNDNDVVDDDADSGRNDAVHSDGEVAVSSHVNDDIISEVSADKSLSEANAELCEQDDDEQVPSRQIDVHEDSFSGSLLPKQPTSEVVAEIDISTSMEPAASHCEELKTEMMDVVESQSDVMMISQQDTAAGPSDAAVAMETVEQDERQRLRDVVADIDTDVQQSTKSPRSMFFLC